MDGVSPSNIIRAMPPLSIDASRLTPPARCSTRNSIACMDPSSLILNHPRLEPMKKDSNTKILGLLDFHSSKTGSLRNFMPSRFSLIASSTPVVLTIS